MKCIKRPKLVVCPDKSTMYPPTTWNPLYVINKYLLKHKKDVIGINYDGYIVHQRSKDITQLLLLREYYTNCDTKSHLNKIINEVLCDNPLCEARVSIACHTAIPISLFLIPENYPLENDDKQAYIVENIVDCRNYSVTESNMVDFVAFIDKFRGGKYKKKAKGLNAANTKFECFLANNNGYTPLPGDIDGLIIRKNKALAILEFKTHNKSTPIEEEYLGKYGYADWRRIQVLHDLKRKLDIPIIVIFWGPNHQKLKIDKIVETEKIEESQVVGRENFVEILLSMISVKITPIQ